MVYDDYFETIQCTDSKPPDNWEDLIILQSFRSEIDDDEDIPPLSEEWLEPAPRSPPSGSTTSDSPPSGSTTSEA